jgi:Family of unknown function (DUF6461)
MTATAADYTWFSERFWTLTGAYCLTLVEGLSRAETLKRIGAQTDCRLVGVHQLTESAYTKSRWGGEQGVQTYVGATSLGEWTLMVEPNGFLGVTEKVIVPLSRGVRLVSHYKNGDSDNRFCWVEDGDVRLRFEPMFAYHRTGSDPDGMVDVLPRLGFDLARDEDRHYERYKEAAFALAEHITGVRLTAEILESADFLCGLARLPAAH